jgi:hypothetical protein
MLAVMARSSSTGTGWPAAGPRSALPIVPSRPVWVRSWRVNLSRREEVVRPAGWGSAACWSGCLELVACWKRAVLMVEVMVQRRSMSS